MNKTILITGAASGIGKATFEALNPDYFQNIILIDREPVEVTSANVFAFKCDISNSQEVEATFKQIQEKGLKITHAFNAAGMPGPNKPFNMSSIEEFDKIIAVNLRGTFLMMREELKVMEQNNFGKILNVTSVLASCGMKGSSYYSASKAGIVAMSKSLAIEYAEKNIQINCISPGGVDTNLISDLKRRIGVDTLKAIHPVKRIATSEEIATYVKFIMENDTSFMTGSELMVDGGYSAQ
jgi:NAD(P)-dependent dehydrogenase (short-subunit alcohol dehydrogenase family)